MSQTAQSPGLLWPAVPRRRSLAGVDPWIVASGAIVVFAMAVRVAGADRQSAYMDEGTNVLTGRMLIEQHAIYAEILNWAYGSYLWPLLAGAADALGGLAMVRGLSAFLGVLMVVATAATAARLAPDSVNPKRRWGVALLAGGIMAVAPTAVAVGRFGTYDALAGAALMLGLTLLVPASRSSGRIRLLTAAALLFVAFLAKYLVAIYFPFVSAYVVLAAFVGHQRNARFARSAAEKTDEGSPDRSFDALRRAIHTFIWFVAPLAAACAVYAWVFLSPLLTLLSSSLHYADLKSSDPLREYVWTRPELWLLVAAAVFGWRRATWSGRLNGLGGASVIVAFQLGARPDFDFWKHSIYVIYFLAPLAGLTWLAVPQNTGTWRVVAVVMAGVVAVWSWSPTLREANRLIDFYPNLNSSLDAIDANIAGAALVLTDDTALRYYLYPGMGTDRVVGPFFFNYRAYAPGPEAYRRAIADRFFDAIVLDGGVTPQGNAFRQQLGSTINDFYQRVYSSPDGGGFTVEVFKPLRPAGTSGAESAELTWPEAYTFDQGLEGWGAHPDVGDWQAGLQTDVAPIDERSWEGHPALRFVPTPDASTITLRRSGHVSRIRARVYLVSNDAGAGPMRVGFIGFDDAWRWHDDGFRWVVPPASWTTITWDLASPGDYEELGLKLPLGVSQAYIGALEIDP